MHIPGLQYMMVQVSFGINQKTKHNKKIWEESWNWSLEAAYSKSFQQHHIPLAWLQNTVDTDDLELPIYPFQLFLFSLQKKMGGGITIK